MNPHFMWFVLIHRLFTFLDEWGWYLAMLFLWCRGDYLVLAPVFVFGAIATSVSYRRQWKFEKMLLGRLRE